MSVLLRRCPVVRLARLRRRVLDSLNLQGADLRACSPCVTFAVLYGAFLRSSRPTRRRWRRHLSSTAAGAAAGRAGASWSRWGLPLLVALVAGAGMMAEVDHLRAVLRMRPADAPAPDPIFGRPLGLLPVHPARLAAHRRLAADTGRDRLRSLSCLLSSRHEAQAADRSASRRRRRRGCGGVGRARLAAGAAGAGGCASISAAIERLFQDQHHFRRCHLHRCARHPDRHAGRLRSRWSLGAR